MLNRRKASRGAGLLLLFVVGGPGCGVQTGWPETGAFNTAGSDEVARFFHRASLLPDVRVLVSGGMTVRAAPASLVSLDRLSIFDAATGSFEQAFGMDDGMPIEQFGLHVPRSSHTQTTLADGRVLITGGYTAASGTGQGTAIDSVEIVDPQRGVVATGPPMAHARADHSATPLSDGRVVVAGGGGWQVFNPATDSWSQEYPLQRTRLAHAAVRLPAAAGNDERVLIVGGAGSGPDTMELLCPSTGVSQPSVARLSIGVDDLAAAALEGGRVLIVGGQDPPTGETVDLAYLYDPVMDELVSAPRPPNLPNGIADHEIISIGGRAFIFGGESEHEGRDTELDYAAYYDEQTGEWQTLPPMTQARDDFAAVALLDGRVALVAGGTSFFGIELPTNTAEIFTPP